jgi:predicted porin
MKRHTYLTGAVIGLALACASAQADVKDPLPDSLSLGGITLYATVDVGYAYQSSGVPINSQIPGGLEYQAFTTTRNFSGSQSTVAESGLEQSKIGIRVSQPLVNDVSLVARAETGFNPLSGQLTDACASIANNAGKTVGNQTANADSSRCGQAFNAQLFGGVSSPVAGQLTVGRHNSLQLDALAQFDPQALSYAFSFLGYSGFNGGAGSTEGARWDNSIRYAFQSGPVHIAGMYSSGGQDTGILGKAYGVDAGVTFQGLSVEAVYENEKGAVNLRSSFDDLPNPLAPQPTVVDPFPTPGLAAYLSDDTSYNVMAKYTFDLGDASQKDKLTIYAGYSHMEKANSSYTAGSSEGNYLLNVGINVNNSAVYNMEWVGARYAMGSITFRRTAGRSASEEPAHRASAAARRACCARATSRKRPLWSTTSSTSTMTSMAASTTRKSPTVSQTGLSVPRSGPAEVRTRRRSCLAFGLESEANPLGGD